MCGGVSCELMGALLRTLLRVVTRLFWASGLQCNEISELNVLLAVSCRVDEVGTAVYAPLDKRQLKEMVSTALPLVGGAPCDHTPSLCTSCNRSCNGVSLPSPYLQVKSLAEVLLELIDLWK